MDEDFERIIAKCQRKSFPGFPQIKSSTNFLISIKNQYIPQSLRIASRKNCLFSEFSSWKKDLFFLKKCPSFFHKITRKVFWLQPKPTTWNTGVLFLFYRKNWLFRLEFLDREPNKSCQNAWARCNLVDFLSFFAGIHSKNIQIATKLNFCYFGVPSYAFTKLKQFQYWSCYESNMKELRKSPPNTWKWFDFEVTFAKKPTEDFWHWTKI